MADDTAARELERTLTGMQTQSRALNDALRKLADEGLSDLTRSAARQSSGGRSNNQSAGEIASTELARVLKAELGESLKQVFAPARSDSVFGGASGALNVIIHNNTSASVTAQETSGGYDQRTLEITIDQMVAQSLVHGRQTGSVLQSLFGLVPSLIGR